MAAFVLIAAGLLVLALWPLLAVLLRAPPRQARAPVQQAHLQLLQAERVQLDADLKASVLRPDEHAQAVGELARRVLQETAAAEPVAQTAHRMLTAGVMLLAVPAVAVGFYGSLGSPDLVRFGGDDRSPDAVTASDVESMLRQMAAGLAERSARGDDPVKTAEAWALMARTQMGLQRFAEAADSLDRALALQPDRADWLADRADLLMLLQAPGAHSTAQQLVQRALRIDPDHPKALALAGGTAYEQGRFADAERLWKQALVKAPAGGSFAQGLGDSIASARAAQGLATPVQAAAVSTATATAGVGGRVELGAQALAELRAGDTLFIVARAPQGPRLPLAVLRLPAISGPVDFALDDRHAMSPDHKLSLQREVVVEARISRSGQAMPQPGDWSGRSGTVATGGSNVRVVIDRKVE